jgi:hypothetical protein
MILWTYPNASQGLTACAEGVDEAAHAAELIAGGLVPAGSAWEIVAEVPAAMAAAILAKQTAAATLAAGIAADTATLKADNAMRNLMKATPAQIDAWVAANVTDLASARNAIRLLARAVSVIARAQLEN